MAEFANGKIIEKDKAKGDELLSMGVGKKSEEGVVLHWLEAAFLAQKKLIEVKNQGKTMKLEDFLNYKDEKDEVGEKKKKNAKKGKEKSSAPSRADQYNIYYALRSGGRVVRFFEESPLHWRVYERGVGREQERPQMLLYIVPPDWSVDIQALEQQMQLARLLRLELAIAFVKEGKPQMLKISRPPLE
jgi:tRNA splicing endonuclease